MSTNRLLLSACAVVGVCTPAFAAVETLFGCEYPGFHDLSVVDQNTGALSSVVPTGWPGLTDMTSDTRAGSERLWAVDAASLSLITVTSGGSTFVTLNAPDQIVSIAFDVVTGKLYGNSSVGYGAQFDALYEIDPGSGNCSFIGRITFDNVYALGFDQNGTLFGVADVSDQLISISTATGNGSLIANLPQLSGFDLASRPSDNTMFLAQSDASGFLSTIDTTTGVITPVGAYELGGSRNVTGLAFGIPAPSTASLAVLGLAGIARRRARG